MIERLFSLVPRLLCGGEEKSLVCVPGSFFSAHALDPGNEARGCYASLIIATSANKPLRSEYCIYALFRYHWPSSDNPIPPLMEQHIIGNQHFVPLNSKVSLRGFWYRVVEHNVTTFQSYASREGQVEASTMGNSAILIVNSFDNGGKSC